MRKYALRGSVATLAISALVAGPAHAAITKVADQPLIDASSDGRFVLLADGSVIERATGTSVLGPDRSESLDLASRSAATLELDASALFLRTPQSPDGTFVGIGTDGFSVPVTSAKLVRDGKAVVFSTSESPSRILLRDLTTNTTTELLSRASLLDASEDGKVVTWIRQIAGTPRTAGQPLDSDPGPSASGQAVGYTVGGESRIVSRTTWTQRAFGPQPDGPCPTTTVIDKRWPTGLQISQDGTGRYSLVLSTAVQPGGGYPFAAGSTTRLTATSNTDATLITSDGQVTTSTTQVDPESGAAASILSDKANGFPLANRLYLSQPSGASQGVPVIGQFGTTDPIGAYKRAVPVNGGAAVVYAFSDRSGGPTGGPVETYLRDGFTPGTDATPWLSLPRSIDPANVAGASVDATYIVCTATPSPTPTATPTPAVVPGTIDDYVPALGTQGFVTFAFTPSGKLPARSGRATITWFGVPIWDRTVTASTNLTLPRFPVVLPGVRLIARVKLSNDTVLSASQALARPGR